MNIITESSKIGRVQDGIRTILKLDDDTFEEVIRRLTPRDNSGLEPLFFYYSTDVCSNPNNVLQLGLEEYSSNGEKIVRGYYAEGAEIKVRELFPMLEAIAAEIPTTSREYERLVRMLGTRDLEKFKKFYIENINKWISPETMDMTFGILSDEEKLKRFLDYNNNQDEFAIEGIERPKHAIVQCISDAFGPMLREGEFRQDNEMHQDFYIPDLELYKHRVSEIYHRYNGKRYTNGVYEFRSTIVSNKVLRKGDEPDFQINEELYKAVYDGMPKDLSLEEQMVFIYSRLCKELGYDEEYMYKSILDKPIYNGEFSKEHLEGIKPGSKVTCYDFSRIFAKFINQIDGDIEAVILVKGENGEHFLVGAYTEDISATFDAINVERGDPTNDLVKAKIGAPIRGIGIKFDDKNILLGIRRRIYPKAIGKEPTFIRDYIRELKSTAQARENSIEAMSNSQDIISSDERNENSENLIIKVRALVEAAKKAGAFGNELTQLCNAAEEVDFFGTYLEKAYLGSLETTDDAVQVHRIILMRTRNYYGENENPIIAIDTSKCEVEQLSKEQAIARFMLGVWEDGEHRMGDLPIGNMKPKLDTKQHNKAERTEAISNLPIVSSKSKLNAKQDIQTEKTDATSSKEER